MAENRYRQVMETLRRRIEGGEYPVGSRLPAETELAAALGVSRPTLRQALAGLEREGLLDRVKGSGTFVAQPKLLHESTRFLAGYYQEAAKLALPATAQVTQLTRRRRIEGFDGGKPVVYTTVYVPYALLPDMARQDFTDTSFYAYLARCGLKVCHASRTLEVIAPPPEIAAALALSPFEPAVYVESVGFDARGRRVEYAQSYYPAGSSRFLIEIDR